MNKTINSFIHLFFKDTGSVNIQSIVKKSFSIFSIQLISVVFIFIGNVLVARWFGEENYGLYSHIFNWFSLLSIIAIAGMDDYHIAVLPGLKLKNDFGSIRKILKWSLISIAVASAIVMVVFSLVVSNFKIKGLYDNQFIFRYSISLILLFAISSNLTSFLRGLDVIVKSQLAEKILRPLIFIGVLAVFFFTGKSSQSIFQLIAAMGVAVFIGLIFQAFLIKKSLGSVSNAPAVKTAPDFSFSRNKYFLAMSILYVLTARIDILSLGSMVSLKEVGYYNVALKFADIIAYPVVIINLVIPTFLSKHHHLQDKSEIFKLIRNGARGMFFGCIIALTVAVAAGPALLTLYGENFITAYQPLIILGIAQLITAFAGPVCAYFLVSGGERIATICMLSNVLVTITGCYFLIPHFGINGAAVANLLGFITFNLLLAVFFYRREGAWITPFSVVR
jgi:O-antigen/teichoic acid export membrane protein